MQNSHYKGPY